MISGDKERSIEWYLPIDHCAEGCGIVKPADDEEFRGVPYAWYTDTASPFIKVLRDGKVIRTVNALDISEIGFAEENP